MSWSKNCITSEIKRTPEITADDHVQSRSTIEIRFQSHNTKLNAPIVTSSIDCDITTKRQLDYMIDSLYSNISTLFVLWLKAGESEPTRDTFSKYYLPLVEIKDFNALNDSKPFSDHPIKNKKKHLKNISKRQERMIIEQKKIFVSSRKL